MKLRINCKNICVYLLLSLFSNMYSQDFVKSDTLRVNNKTYKTFHISFGNTSGLKLFKVMTCSTSKINQIKKEIIDCNKNNKLEYTEFYIVVVNNLKNASKKINLDILTSFFNKIDNERMNQKLSTSLIKSKLKTEDFTYEYFTDKPKNEIKDLENYKLNIRFNEVCNFLKGDIKY